MKNHTLLILTTTLLLSLDLQAASYDCAKASTNIEVAICENARLSDLDEQLAEKYSLLRNTLPEPISKNLRLEQIEWLKTRNKLCHEATFECLNNRYFNRIRALKKLEEMRLGIYSYNDGEQVVEYPNEFPGFVNAWGEYIPSVLYEPFTTISVLNYLSHRPIQIGHKPYNTLEHPLAFSKESERDIEVRSCQDYVNAINDGFGLSIKESYKFTWSYLKKCEPLVQFLDSSNSE